MAVLSCPAVAGLSASVEDAPPSIAAGLVCGRDWPAEEAAIFGEARAIDRLSSDEADHVASIERNIRLYPLYQGLRSLFFWVPVFFLYLSARVSTAEVLLLEAVYYGAVVTLEVPSGYMSDALGRRRTLIVSAASYVAACVLFLVGETFAVLALAQIGFASAGAFNSGTDASLLYESLAEVGRDGEVGELEAQAQSYQFIGLAISGPVGGALGTLDLRLPYLACLLAGLAVLVIALRFTEPGQQRSVAPPLAQLRTVAMQLRQLPLAVVFAFAAAMTVFEHVPYEMFQPYIRMIFHDRPDVSSLVSGIVVFAMMMVGAWTSRIAIGLGRRISIGGLLVAGLLIQLAIVAAMAIAVHPAILLVVILRTVPMAWFTPVTAGIVQPMLPSEIRATYLSAQSLAGSLAFSLTLVSASLLTQDHALTRPGMLRILLAYLLLGVVVLPALTWAAFRLNRTLTANA